MATAIGRIPRHARTGTSTRYARPWSKRAVTGAALRAELHLAAGERVLVRLGRAHSATVVATERALYWRAPVTGWTRLGWDEIGSVAEDSWSAGLVVTGVSDHRAQPAVLPCRADHRLVALARERIAATRIVRTRLAVDGGELLVEGRRLLGTGELRWFVRLGPGLDPRDSALPSRIEDALAELRAELGV